MPEPIDHVMGLIFGRWRSQILYTGVELGVFEVLKGTDEPQPAGAVAEERALDRQGTYRLMRALASLGLLAEDGKHCFSLTEAGELLLEDNPISLRGIARLENGPTHYEVWKYLGDLVREGVPPNGFQREFGHGVFTHLEQDPAYTQRFNEAMTSLSRLESEQVKGLLGDKAFEDVEHVCDVGGGHGHLLCTLLEDAPGTRGTVLELSEVANAEEGHQHEPMGLTDRVDFVVGDFFEGIPSADAYLMKHILHDWSDDECIQILSSVRQAAPEGARLFVCELVIPGPDRSHLSKLFDVQMMLATTGRERTVEEYDELFAKSGWERVKTYADDAVLMSTIEAHAV